MEASGFHVLSLCDVFVATVSDEAICCLIVFPCMRELKKQGFGVTQLHTTWIKNDFVCGPVWDTLFLKTNADMDALY